LADIAAFNAAVKAGDYKAAAAETATIWPGFDKTSPDTAVAAREFGFANLVAGDYAAARDFGLFLRDHGPTLEKPDGQPAASAVLLALADYRLDAKTAHDELLAALQARAARPGLDNISLMATEVLYRGDWAAGAWSKAEKSADLAATLLDRGGPSVKVRADRARVTAAAAQFMASPSAQDIEVMETVFEAIADDIDKTTDPRNRAALGREMFQAFTWLNAIDTAISSYTQQTGSIIPTAVKRRQLKYPAQPVFPDDKDPLPVCAGEFDLDNFRYPASAEFRGMAGAVTMKFDTDDSGHVVKAEVLGSVPVDIFADALVKASPRFRWVPKQADIKGKCRLRRHNYIYTVVFQIG
jgi:TonB family protein